MDRLGKYEIKPYTKYRRNIEIITGEGWRKRTTHAILKFDVTIARKLIKKHHEKTGDKISMTGWIIKCIAQALSEHKELNAYKQGRRKIFIFDDVDFAIPVEKIIDNDARPRVYILRRANEKSVFEITKEIRSVQKQKSDESTQLLGKKITRFERFILKSPTFFQKILMWFARHHVISKKKFFGTVSVTAIGMIGKFPGWVVPLGGMSTINFVIGGIIKSPTVIKDKIAIREILHITLSTDHDIVDGGPLARFVERITELLEDGYSLSEK